MRYLMCLVILALIGCGGSGSGPAPATMSATVNGSAWAAAVVTRDGSTISGTADGVTINLALPSLAEGQYRLRPIDASEARVNGAISAEGVVEIHVAGGRIHGGFVLYTTGSVWRVTDGAFDVEAR